MLTEKTLLNLLKTSHEADMLLAIYIIIEHVKGRRSFYHCSYTEEHRLRREIETLHGSIWAVIKVRLY